MAMNRIPAVFARGGTSNALIFKDADLPADQSERDTIFLRALGSPDPYGRQLDGMGGGISSLSKIVIVKPSQRPDADVEYTFAQVAVSSPDVDYGGTCGNMSSAVGPFAIDEGLVARSDGEVTVRVYSTNTRKLYHAGFHVRDGKTVEGGDFSIPGVSGTGARIQLDYLEPGGGASGRLLPTGNAIDTLSVAGLGEIGVSMVDASNPVAFIAADQLGLTATERPDVLDAKPEVMASLDRIRRAAGVAMGLGETDASVPLSTPFIAIVAPPAPFEALEGRPYSADAMALTLRVLSMGNTHRAVPLTGAMCTAVAARITGSVVQHMAHGLLPDGDLRIANPSGVLPVNAAVSRSENGSWKADRATVYRTQRRLMEGWVRI